MSGYFKINGVDYSIYVNELKIKKSANYNSQTNAAGDTVVDLLNTKRQIEVGIITLDESVAKGLLQAVDGFNVTISYRDPRSISDEILEEVNCIIPSTDVEYYTIRSNKVMLNDFKLKFTEL